MKNLFSGIKISVILYLDVLKFSLKYDIFWVFLFFDFLVFVYLNV